MTSTSDRHQRVYEVFTGAAALEGAQREHYIREQCGSDNQLRAEIESLLNCDDESFLANPIASIHVRQAVQAEASVQSPPVEVGSRIGGYRIIDVLGEGGMGVVYRAEQSHPRRTVALKVIRPGMISPALLRRFQTEAETLGRLHHPGIAQIYEAGTFDAGGGEQPFFAMEMIEGLPLLEYADRHELDRRTRLSLLIRICDAVEHAHRRGVIHRDLKPANIVVVSEEDLSTAERPQSSSSTEHLLAHGIPKILDFGVARLADEDVQTTRQVTVAGQLIGTVPYMSPEQITGDPTGIDTRSDVYALGVVSYELLTGRLPYDLTGKLIHEAARIVQEVDPAMPSSCDRSLRGDLETILLKALEKNRDRRYQSAAALAEDLRRFLHDEPIIARPPTAMYQFRKFARRNKALVAGVLAVFVVLVAGLIGTTYGLARAIEAQAVAERSEQDALAAKEMERERAEELEAVVEFQQRRLAGIDTDLMGRRLRNDILERYRSGLLNAALEEDLVADRVALLDEMLGTINFTNIALLSLDQNIFEQALAAIEEQFDDQPVIKARLLQTIATTLPGLGLIDRATAPQMEALEIRRQVLGDEHPETVRSLSSTGLLMLRQGRLSAAEQYLHEAFETASNSLGDLHPSTLEAINSMGYLMWMQGRPADAMNYFRKAMDGNIEVLGEDDPATLSTMNNVGFLLHQLGQFPEAEEQYRKVLDSMTRAYGERHVETLTVMNNLGELLRMMGRFAEAEDYLTRALAGRRQVLGDESPSTLNTINNLALVHQERGQNDEAEHLFTENLRGRRKLFGDNHPDTLNALTNLGYLLLEINRLDDAEPYLADALAGCRRLFGDNHPNTLEALRNMGRLLEERGDLPSAEAHYREAMNTGAAVLSDEHPFVLATTAELGMFLLGVGDLDAADEHLSRVYEIRMETLGPDHPQTVGIAVNIASLRREQGRLEESAALFDHALKQARSRSAANHWRTAAQLVERSRTMLALERYADAERDLLEAHAIFSNSLGPSHRRTLQAAGLLATLYNNWHTLHPDRGYDASAAQWHAAAVPGEVPQ